MIKPITNHNITISDGEAGILQTVDYMWNYALRDAKEPLTLATVADLQGKTKLETIRNIFDFVVKSVKYKLDPAEYEMVTAPIHYLNGNRKTGDCDCMTTLLVCLLEAAGFDCSITIIQWRIAEYTHVFAEVWHANAWFILDATLGNRGFGKQDKKIAKFRRITKKDMAKLVVLADGAEPHERINKAGKAYRTGNSGRYCNNSREQKLSNTQPIAREDDNRNKNANNITINFGTTSENSYNNSESNSYSKEKTSEEKIKNTQLRAKPAEVPSIATNEQSREDLTNSDNEPKASKNEPIGSLQGLLDLLNKLKASSNDSNEQKASNNSNSFGSVIVSEGNKPLNYVASTKSRKPSYIEFP